MHLLAALQIIEAMKETPFLISANARDVLMDMGLSSSAHATEALNVQHLSLVTNLVLKSKNDRKRI